MGQANERKMEGECKENDKEMEDQRQRGRDGTQLRRPGGYWW